MAAFATVLFIAGFVALVGFALSIRIVEQYEEVVLSRLRRLVVGR